MDTHCDIPRGKHIISMGIHDVSNVRLTVGCGRYGAVGYKLKNLQVFRPKRVEKYETEP